MTIRVVPVWHLYSYDVYHSTSLRNFFFPNSLNLLLLLLLHTHYTTCVLSRTPGCVWCNGVCRDGKSNGGSSTAADYSVCIPTTADWTCHAWVADDRAHALWSKDGKYVENTNTYYLWLLYAVTVCPCGILHLILFLVPLLRPLLFSLLLHPLHKAPAFVYGTTEVTGSSTAGRRKEVVAVATVANGYKSIRLREWRHVQPNCSTKRTRRRAPPPIHAPLGRDSVLVHALRALAKPSLPPPARMAATPTRHAVRGRG